MKAIVKYPTYVNPNLTQQEQQIVNIIGKYESDSAGGYDAVNQGGANRGRTVLGYSGPFSQMPQHGGRQLTELTVGEIMELQSDDGSSVINGSSKVNYTQLVVTNSLGQLLQKWSIKWVYLKMSCSVQNYKTRCVYSISKKKVMDRGLEL